MNQLTLSQLSILLGALGVAAGLWPLIAPAQVRRMLDAFPRSTPTAWILTAVSLLWVTWLLFQTPLGGFEYLKPTLYFLAPLSFFLLINFLDELLAPRALGGLLMLAANPVLKIAQWQDTEWRLVIIVLAYVWVVAGMALVLSPYLFRRAVLWIVPTEARHRLAALAKLAFGLGLLVLGLTVF
jgi:hypothetical protein